MRITRKILTTLIAIPFSLLIIFAVFFGEWGFPTELISMTVMFSIALLPFILLYGVPVSILSDFIGRRLNGRVRIVAAFTTHLVFGVLFGYIFPSNLHFTVFNGQVDTSLIFAPITSLVFWITDEILRCNRKFRGTVLKR